MKYVLSFLLILTSVSLLHANQQQIDELGIEAELAIEDQNWSEADRVLTKLKNIGADLGVKELYTHLKIMEQLEQYGRILEEIDGVIASIGRDNKLYKPLLKLKITSKKLKDKHDLMVKKQDEINQKKQKELEVKNKALEKQRRIVDLKNKKSALINHLVNRKSEVVFFHMPSFMHLMYYEVSIHDFYLGRLNSGFYLSAEMPSGPVVLSIEEGVGIKVDSLLIDLEENKTHYIAIVKKEGLREVLQNEFDQVKRKLKNEGEKQLSPEFIEKRHEYLKSLTLSNQDGQFKLIDNSLEGNFANLKIVMPKGVFLGEITKLFIDDMFFSHIPRGHKLECILPLGTKVELSNQLSESFTISEPGDHYFKFWRKDDQLMNSHDKSEYDRWAKKAKFIKTIDYVKFKKGIAGN